MITRIRELAVDALLFVALPGVVFAIIGYLWFSMVQAQKPEPITYFNQGPQDPVPTH